MKGGGSAGAAHDVDPQCDRPRVSVLVATHLGARLLGGCLDSLGAQTLAPEEFEIVVVINGPLDDTRSVVDGFRIGHPSHRVRLIELRQSGAGHARNVGLSSVRGDYVTFVDDDDRVSAPFLEGLLDAAEPDVVSVAMIGDVRADDAPGAEPDTDTYVGRGLAPQSGRVLDAQHLVTAFSYNAAKLVWTAAARRVRYNTSLRSGEDHVYWLELFATQRFRFRLVPVDVGAVYLRTVRQGGVGRKERSYDFNVTQRLRCLAAMEMVDRSDPAVAHVAQGLALGQAWWLNSYLLHHPDDHARLVEDARALGLREIPWGAVNAGLARDLAICYCFPPDLDTSGMVAARRLRERGVVVDVISQDLSKLRTVDPEALRVVAEVLDQTHLVGGVASFVRWSAVVAFAEEAWSTVETWEATRGPYRSVYSRAMAPTSHFAAALVKLRRPDVEWVAEFSDPLKVNAVGEERIGDVTDDWLSRELYTGMLEAGFQQPEGVEVFDLAERIAYALADRIIFTNSHQLDYMVGYCPDRRLAERVLEISEVSRHPTLPADFYDMGSTELFLDPTKVHIAYFGVFYSTRGLGEILEALSRLTHGERDRIRLHVFTPQPDTLTLEVVRSGLAGVVEPRPFVGFLDYLHLTTRFDVLLVNDAATKAHSGVNPYLPSKVSDYQGSGKPVWAVFEEGSVLSAMPLDYRSPLGDVEAALEVLRHLTMCEPARETNL